MSALALLAGLGLSAPASAQKIIINQAGQSTTAASIYLAKHMGFFERNGLDVAFFTTGSGIKSIAPLVTGAAQFCACIVNHPMQANHSGAAETRMIAGITAGYPTKIVLRKDIAARLHLTPETPLADRVRMLKGLKIGVTELGASTDLAMRLAMIAYGMNPERDAVIIALGGLPAMLPAMANNQVEAISGSPPAPEHLMSEGVADLLVDPTKERISGLDVALFMALAAEQGYLKKNHDVAIRVVRSIAEAQAYLRDHKEEARKVVKEKEFSKMPQDAFDIAYDYQYSMYQKTPEISRESANAAIKIAEVFIPGFKGTYETEIDPSIAAEVMKK